MKVMAKDMLEAFWRNNNGAKPEHILFYRDGVSEGQFQQVRCISIVDSSYCEGYGC